MEIPDGFRTLSPIAYEGRVLSRAALSLQISVQETFLARKKTTTTKNPLVNILGVAGFVWSLSQLLNSAIPSPKQPKMTFKQTTMAMLCPNYILFTRTDGGQNGPEVCKMLTPALGPP